MIVRTFVILLLGISGLFVPFMIICLILIFFERYFMGNDNVNKKAVSNNMSIIISIAGLIVSVFAAYFTWTQAHIAKEATTPYVTVQFFNDERLHGIYISNAGKGHAIIDKIKIDDKEYDILDREKWDSILKEKKFEVGVECFAFSSIQKNIILSSSDTQLIIGRRKALWDELKELQKNQIDLNNMLTFTILNQLIISEISRSENTINGKIIIEKFNELIPSNLRSNLRNSENDTICTNIDDSKMNDLVNKLKELKVVVYYHSIIDDESIESKELK